MPELSAAETDRATSEAIHDLGSVWMIHRETRERGAAQGYENPYSFYFAGRAGVLGDVDAEVVCSAFGWFAPGVVRSMWEEGVAVHGARDAAARYFSACADWGRDHLAGLDGLDRFADLAERVVSAAGTSGRSLFAGWKVEPRVSDGAGRAMQLVHVMREWRGSNHLVATTASGLSPLESVLGQDGERTAKFLGWTEPYPPVSEELRERRQEAERLTDRLCAPAFEALSAPERAEFVDLVDTLSTARSSA